MSKKRIKQITAFQQAIYNSFFQPRQEGDLDLVMIMSFLIRDEIDQRYADIFLNHPDIVSVKDLNTGAQRSIINKYFYGLLLRFKAVSGISILQPQYWLTNEGNQEEWFKLMSGYFIPYCKHYKLFETLYG